MLPYLAAAPRTAVDYLHDGLPRSELPRMGERIHIEDLSIAGIDSALFLALPFLPRERTASRPTPAAPERRCRRCAGAGLLQLLSSTAGRSAAARAARRADARSKSNIEPRHCTIASDGISPRQIRDGAQGIHQGPAPAASPVWRASSGKLPAAGRQRPLATVGTKRPRGAVKTRRPRASDGTRSRPI